MVQGDMLVIPLSGYRLLYIQPIYLQADVGKMPELRRVVVSTGDHIGYGRTLEEALLQLTGKPAGIAAQGKHTEAGKELEELGKTIEKLGG